jgi:triose/dihydroxyacetone kinase / FAD-AMP lyase (cyclizing)
VRILAGTYMTSLNGPGFSITLLNVVNTDIGGPGMIELLDAPAEAVGWAAPVSKLTWEQRNQATRDVKVGAEQHVKPSGLKVDPAVFKTMLENGLKRVVAVEREVTEYDTVVGDGDCGVGMRRGAEGKQRTTLEEA